MSASLYQKLDAASHEAFNLEQRNIKLMKVVQAAEALLADVHHRYPGEELHCPYMKALEEACRKVQVPVTLF